MDLNARSDLTVTLFPVPIAFANGSKGLGLNVVFSNDMLASCDGFASLALKDVGERQKSSDQAFGASDGERVEPFLITSIIRLGALGKVLISSGIRDSSYGRNATEGNFICSLTSLTVKAA